MKYDPGVFESVATLKDAKRIILTDEAVLTTDQRWERETPHICDLIEQNIRLSADSVVLDYGCGVGRIARELIRRHGCFVIGVDIAPNMLGLAASYVASERLVLCQPQALPLLDVKADAVIAIWVLQHVANLAEALAQIKQTMKPDGRLFVVNETAHRFVPTAAGWVDDRLDVSSTLSANLQWIAGDHLSPDVVGDEQSIRTFWAAYAQGE